MSLALLLSDSSCCGVTARKGLALESEAEAEAEASFSSALYSAALPANFSPSDSQSASLSFSPLSFSPFSLFSLLQAQGMSNQHHIESIFFSTLSPLSPPGLPNRYSVTMCSVRLPVTPSLPSYRLPGSGETVFACVSKARRYCYSCHGRIRWKAKCTVCLRSLPLLLKHTRVAIAEVLVVGEVGPNHRLTRGCRTSDRVHLDPARVEEAQEVGGFLFTSWCTYIRPPPNPNPNLKQKQKQKQKQKYF